MIAWMPLHKESPKELRDVLVYTTYQNVYVAHLWRTVSHTPPPEFRQWWRIHRDNRDLRYDEVTHWAVLNFPEEQGNEYA